MHSEGGSPIAEKNLAKTPVSGFQRLFVFVKLMNTKFLSFIILCIFSFISYNSWPFEVAFVFVLGLCETLFLS